MCGKVVIIVFCRFFLLVARASEQVSRGWRGELEGNKAQSWSHHMQHVLDYSRVVQEVLHLLVDAASSSLLLFREPASAEADQLGLVLLEGGELVHGCAAVAELALGPFQLLHDVAVGDSHVHHVVHPLGSTGDGLSDSCYLSKWVLRLGRDSLALQVEEILANPPQLVIIHAQHFSITWNVLIELDVLQEILEIKALGHFLWAHFDPYLPVGAIESLHLEGDGNLVRGMRVTNHGPEGVRQRAEAPPLQISLLHGEWVRGRGAHVVAV